MWLSGFAAPMRVPTRGSTHLPAVVRLVLLVSTHGSTDPQRCVMCGPPNCNHFLAMQFGPFICSILHELNVELPFEFWTSLSLHSRRSI